MNKKYTEDFREKIKRMRDSGMTYQAIADELAMNKQTVHYICTYKAHVDNKIAPCRFCGSDKTRVDSTRSRGYRKYYVRCLECGARGPGMVFRGAEHQDSLREYAMIAWNTFMEG